MDGDGDPDLAVGNTKHPNRLYRNNGGTVQVDWSGFVGTETLDLAWGNVDGDGDLDLVAANGSQPNRIYYSEGGELTIAQAASLFTDLGAVGLGDLDGDGDGDLAGGRYGQPLALYRNQQRRIALLDAPGITVAQPAASPPLRAAAGLATPQFLGGATQAFSYTLRDELQTLGLLGSSSPGTYQAS